jgi:hypothetical protein
MYAVCCNSTTVISPIIISIVQYHGPAPCHISVNMEAFTLPQYQEDDVAYQLGSGTSGAGGDDLDSTADSPHRVLSGGTNNESDMTEFVSQAEILSLPALEGFMAMGQMDSDIKNVAEDSDSKEHVMSSANESLSTPLSNLESNGKGMIIDASENEVESSPADEEETKLEHDDASSRPIVRHPISFDLEDLTDDQKIVFKRLQTASYKEREDMVNNPAFSDVGGLWLRDSRGIYRPLGGATRALRGKPKKTLCDLCKGITVETVLCRGGYKHAKDYTSLEKSAEHCPLCKMLKSTADVDYLEKDDVVEDTQTMVYFSRTRETGGDRYPHMTIFVPEHIKTAGRWHYIPLNTDIGTTPLECKVDGMLRDTR